MRTNRCGDVTGQVWKSGSSKFEMGQATIIPSRSSDLAKLNPKCHMNYSNYLQQNETIVKKSK